MNIYIEKISRDLESKYGSHTEDALYRIKKTHLDSDKRGVVDSLISDYGKFFDGFFTDLLLPHIKVCRKFGVPAHKTVMEPLRLYNIYKRKGLHEAFRKVHKDALEKISKEPRKRQDLCDAKDIQHTMLMDILTSNFNYVEFTGVRDYIEGNYPGYNIVKFMSGALNFNSGTVRHDWYRNFSTFNANLRHAYLRIRGIEKEKESSQTKLNPYFTNIVNLGRASSTSGLTAASFDYVAGFDPALGSPIPAAPTPTQPEESKQEDITSVYERAITISKKTAEQHDAALKRNRHRFDGVESSMYFQQTVAPKPFTTRRKV